MIITPILFLTFTLMFLIVSTIFFVSGGKLITLSFLSLVAHFLLVSIPGVFISNGLFMNEFLANSSSGIKEELVLINFLSLAVFSLSMLLSNVVCRRYSLLVTPRKFLESKEMRTSIMLLGVISFVIIYYFFANGTSPLINLILGHGELSNILTERASLRDGSLSFISSRLDWLYSPVSVLLLFLALGFYIEDKNINSFLILALMLCFAVFIKLYRLGRDDVLPIVLSLLLIFSYGKNRINLAIPLVLGTILITFWSAFSAYEQSFSDIIFNLASRFFNQTAFTYFQLDYINDGFLFLDGIKKPWGGEVISPSKLVYEEFYNRTGGSTAGFAFFHLYVIFGYFSIILCLFMWFLVFAIERLILNGIDSNSSFNRYFYGVIFCMFFIPITFNLFSIYNTFIVFSLGMWVFLLLSLVFFRFKLVRTL